MPSRSPAPAPDSARLRAAVVAAGRRLGEGGLIAAGEGNISVRLGGGQLLITPAGRRKDELAEDELVVVAERANAGAGVATTDHPSSDIAIHRAIYAARLDVLAVAHAHLPAAMALTLVGQVPEPAVLPETALLLPRMPFVPFAPAGSDELAAAIALAISEGPTPSPGAALLERHGAIAVGDAGGDPESAVAQAVDRLELVEVLCRTWRDALLVRAAATVLGAGAILRPPGSRPGAPARGSRRDP